MTMETPFIIHFSRIFPYKSSIWKPPSVDGESGWVQDDDEASSKQTGPPPPSQLPPPSGHAPKQQIGRKGKNQPGPREGPVSSCGVGELGYGGMWAPKKQLFIVTGWWFGIWNINFIFPYIGFLIIPID